MTSAENGQSPPQDISAELAVLAAVLAGGLAKVADILGPRSFYRPLHQHIYDTAGTLARTGAPVEPASVLSALHAAGGPMAEGAISLLRDLLSPPVGDPAFYALKVAEAAERRLVVEIGTRLRQRGYSRESLDQIRAAAVLDLAAILDGPDPGAAGLTFTAAERMTMKAAKWLDDRRIPAGAITLLAGREGIGKSTLALDIAARLTRGELRGTRWYRPAGVAVVAGEDAWAEVILPRLAAARADASRVFRVEPAARDGVVAPLSVPEDLPALRAGIREHGIALLVLDPLMSVVAAHLDTHRDREVRQALDPLSRFASETGCAVLALIHVNKGSTTDPVNSIMGSRAFGAVARSVLFCLADPSDEQTYLYGHVKSNLGPKQPTLTYRIQETPILLDERTGEQVPSSRIRWGPEDPRTIAEALDAPRERASGELAAAILEWMAEQGRTVTAKELKEAFSEIKPNTLNQNLKRMVERDPPQLVRPVHGHYALPHTAGPQGDRDDGPGWAS